MSEVSLGESLPMEMKRVRDEVLPEYLKIPEGRFSAAMMKTALDRAANALASGDIMEILLSYQELKGLEL